MNLIQKELLASGFVKSNREMRDLVAAKALMWRYTDGCIIVAKGRSRFVISVQDSPTTRLLASIGTHMSHVRFLGK